MLVTLLDQWFTWLINGFGFWAAYGLLQLLGAGVKRVITR